MVGGFVRIAMPPYDRYGVGKVVRLQTQHAVVRFFDVPGDLDPLEAVIPFSALRLVALPEQTRVFRLDEETGRWQVGRVLDGEGPLILVQFPNGQSANVPREELQIRWRRPITDPVAFLARGVTETPLFAEARSGFVRAITGQRSACLGMGALLSSSIQLTDYQFNVVQRVLQDPVQRYLLADEVGLGKTIEAGVLIRQYILDAASTARVLVVVPAPLVWQWRDELAQRFSLGAWLDDFVRVVGSDDIRAIERHIETAGMLVVDEAHHLSRLGPEGRNPLYEVLRQCADRVPRLLLLSATPVLSDTAGFLRVLHLLDPVVFPLDDLAGFERRVKSRQLVAETVAALVPENILSMEDDLDRLQQAFHDDVTLVRLVDHLRPIVQAVPDEDDEGFLRALSELRAHLSETYKLHRRILRNRRKTYPWATPRRSGLETISYSCVVGTERHRVIDELRVHLVNAGHLSLAQRILFSAAVHVAGGKSISARLRGAGAHDPQTLTLAQQIDALTEQCASNGARLSALVQTVPRLLEASGAQVVVFCDRPHVADSVAEALAATIGDQIVRRHTCLPIHERESDDGDEPWRAFLTDPTQCRVLVCDVRAEEGLNLHGGRKLALHYDLPPSPNRIEQRLGRLDRFGVGDAVRSIALVCSDDPTESAWLECLNEGLQVFDVSMASLQYLVEETLRTATEDWAGEGENGLRRWQAQLGGTAGWVVRERRRIDQQDALDALDEPHSDAYERLESVDDDWQSWREAFDGFALTALQFERRTEQWNGALPAKEQVFRLKYSRDGRQTLLPLQSFISEFLGTIDTEARHSTSRTPLTYPYSFRRNTALSKEGRVRGIRPLRYGDAMVESLQAFCGGDDRGRVFAMWRHMPDYQPRDASGVDLFFRFDFLIDADLPGEDDATRALRRRAEGRFPPQFHTVWIDVIGSATTDTPPSLVAPYQRESNTRGETSDYNLNPRRWQVLQMQSDVPWTTQWTAHCMDASAYARAFIQDLEAVRAHIDRGLAGLQAQHDTRTAQLASRIARLQGAARDAEVEEMQAEKDVHRRLVAAVRSPSVRMDVAGAVFVSPNTPFIQ